MAELYSESQYRTTSYLKTPKSKKSKKNNNCVNG